jgi:acyl carrier protein
VAGAADAGTVAATVAAIWAATLGVDALDLADDFFERGGNSLIAMQVVLRIGAGLGLKLTPADLFEAPTLGEFCGLVERLAQPC